MDIEHLKNVDGAIVRLGLSTDDVCLVDPDCIVALDTHLNLCLDDSLTRKGVPIHRVKSKLKINKQILQKVSVNSELYGEVLLSPFYPGELEQVALGSAGMSLLRDCLVMCRTTHQIQVLSAFKQTIGENWVNIRGEGKIIIRSFGTIIPIRVNGAISIRKDHLLGFEPKLFPRSESQAWWQRLVGLEEKENYIVLEGSGRLWCQSNHFIV